VAITLTVVALTGCAGEGPTDRTAELEVSQPDDSTITAASSTGTVDDVHVAIETSTAAPTTTSGESGGDAAAAEFTRSVFADLRGEDPGCTVAVGRGGAVVFAEAYGAARLDPFEPMTVDTVVDIASVSKQFTATAILLLAERGVVDLDAPLSTYLPDLPAWASRPTVAQLIHHESGIPDYIDLLVERGFVVTGSSPTVADALAALGDVVDLRFAPGTSWEYSNSNYFLLSQIVLAVTGDDLGAFLAAEVFAPLGLDMVLDPIAAIEDKAVSYEQVGGKWQVADSRWEPTIGAGSIQTTPSQLVEWAAQYWEPTIGATTINAERFDAAVDTGQAKYGAGIVEFYVGGDVGRMLSHDGQWGGFVTRFSVAPAHRVAVAVTCTSPTAFGRLRHRRTFDRDLLAAWIGSD
jgi:CubicO group peptidase (beta-lactamase class C family)